MSTPKAARPTSASPHPAVRLGSGARRPASAAGGERPQQTHPGAAARMAAEMRPMGYGTPGSAMGGRKGGMRAVDKVRSKSPVSSLHVSGTSLSGRRPQAAM